MNNKKRALISRGWGGKSNGLEVIGVTMQGKNWTCLAEHWWGIGGCDMGGVSERGLQGRSPGLSREGNVSRCSPGQGGPASTGSWHPRRKGTMGSPQKQEGLCPFPEREAWHRIFMFAKQEVLLTYVFPASPSFSVPGVKTVWGKWRTRDRRMSHVR